jgi:Zn finger protein HypA/HybF involved in hydrogenase expression
MAFFKDFTEKRLKPKCLMCEGDIERSNVGNICNSCKDKLNKGTQLKVKH